MAEQVIHILITSAGTPLGEQVAHHLASGFMFGDQPVSIHLFDDLCRKVRLSRIRNALLEGGSASVDNVIIADNNVQACQNAHFAILIAEFATTSKRSRLGTMERNYGMFNVFSQTLQNHAQPNCKFLIVCHPAHFGTVVFRHFAPHLPIENITALTRTDHDRAIMLIAHRINVPRISVTNIIAWGINSSIQYCDINHATVQPNVGHPMPVRELVNDDMWLAGDFRRIIQSHGYDIGKDPNRAYYIYDTAVGIGHHIWDWWHGTPPNTWVSAGLISNGAYGVPAGELGSFPAYCNNGVWAIAEGIPIDLMDGRGTDARNQSHNLHEEATETFAVATQEHW